MQVAFSLSAVCKNAERNGFKIKEFNLVMLAVRMFEERTSNYVCGMSRYSKTRLHFIRVLFKNAFTGFS